MNLELELNKELQLNQQQVEFYRKNNFIKVKNVFFVGADCLLQSGNY